MDKHEKQHENMLFTSTQACENIVLLCLITVTPQGEEHTKNYPEMPRKMYPLGQEGLYNIQSL